MAISNNYGVESWPGYGLYIVHGMNSVISSKDIGFVGTALNKKGSALFWFGWKKSWS